MKVSDSVYAAIGKAGRVVGLHFTYQAGLHHHRYRAAITVDFIPLGLAL